TAGTQWLSRLAGNLLQRILYLQVGKFLALRRILRGPVAMRMAKQAINEGLKMGMASALKLEEDCYEQVLHTKDRLEDLTAFTHKRKPIYSGE
ncbi:hypothetical protein KSS87_006392, partial [Heliosperma pusillum]